MTCPRCRAAAGKVHGTYCSACWSALAESAYETAAPAAPAATAPTSADPLARWRGGPLDGPARAITDLVLTTFYCTDGPTRTRAARVLAYVCKEAEAIARAVGAA